MDENHNHSEHNVVLKNTWGPLASVLLVVVIYLVSGFAAAFIVGLYPVLRHFTDVQSKNWLNNSVLGFFWLTVLTYAFVLVLVNVFLKVKNLKFNNIGLRGLPKLKDVGYAWAGFFIYLAIYFTIVTSARRFIPQLNLNGTQDIGFSTSTTGSLLWIVFISLVILPPIVEEILFRGFLYTGLRSKLPKIAAALITSVFFASLHVLEGTNGLLWIAGIDTFILSLVLVYLRETTGKLYASMGLHMLKNLLAFSLLFLLHK